MVRADMESAAPRRQSLTAAEQSLPDLLSAYRDVGRTRLAMMGDHSPCKRWRVLSQAGIAMAARSSLRFRRGAPYDSWSRSVA